MVEQGAKERVLQPQEEEGQKSLKQRQLKAAERQKGTEADWEKGATVNGLGTREVEEGRIRRCDTGRRTSGGGGKGRRRRGRCKK